MCQNCFSSVNINNSKESHLEKNTLLDKKKLISKGIRSFLIRINHFLDEIYKKN